MSADDADRKRAELETLRARVAELERELAAGGGAWQPGYYTAYYATSGFLLGMFGAAASLLLNVFGSLLVGQHPLQLIRVYLTFPLGDRALSGELDSGLVLAIGCCLYIGTGMLLGILFHLVLTRWGGPSLPRRLALATALALAVWIAMYYLLLSWLQPLLIGGTRHIVREVPWYVAALTHLVFGWTMALVYPLGLYTPYRSPTEPQ